MVAWMVDYLLTGSNGVLGTKLVEALLARGATFLATDRADCHNSYLGDFFYRSLDITEAEQVDATVHDYQPRTIIHAAAYTAVDRAEAERELCAAINIEGTRQVAAAAARYGARLVYISTDYVFDGNNGPYRETDSPNPLGWYARTKYEGELAVQAVQGTALICRTTVLYGIAPHLRPTFVPWLLTELGAGRSVKIVTDQWSNTTLAEDLVQMILTLVDSGAEGIFNTMGRDWLSRYEFAKQIATHFEYEPQLIQPILTAELAQAAPRPLRAGGVVDKLVAQTGYQPLTVAKQLDVIRAQLQKLK